MQKHFAVVTGIAMIAIAVVVFSQQSGVFDVSMKGQMVPTGNTGIPTTAPPSAPKTPMNTSPSSNGFTCTDGDSCGAGTCAVYANCMTGAPICRTIPGCSPQPPLGYNCDPSTGTCYTSPGGTHTTNAACMASCQRLVTGGTCPFGESLCASLINGALICCNANEVCDANSKRCNPKPPPSSNGFTCRDGESCGAGTCAVYANCATNPVCVMIPGCVSSVSSAGGTTSACASAGGMAGAAGCCAGYSAGTDGVCWAPCSGSNMGPGCGSSTPAGN